jgi:hypothetical protein
MLLSLVLTPPHIGTVHIVYHVGSQSYQGGSAIELCFDMYMY